MMHPKPARPERDPAYLALVRDLNCACCGGWPVEVHHPISGRYSQRKAPDRDAIPLCRIHHQMRHDHPDLWTSIYGPEDALIEPTRAAVERLRANTIGGRP